MFQLCHQCLWWVEPVHGWCPECAAGIDHNRPDPPVTVLAERVGELRQALGMVQARRPALPDQGCLYATTRGLLFVPHHLTNPPVPGCLSGEVHWSRKPRKSAWSPIDLITPFLRRGMRGPIADVRAEPLPLAADTSAIELLLENPGTFFIGAEGVRLIQVTAKRMVIERLHARPVRLSCLGNEREVQRGLVRLAAEPDWSGRIAKQ